MFWFWVFVAPALLLTVAALLAEHGSSAYYRRRLGENPLALPPASVIVPVKGPDYGLGENLAALASLDYPDYELLVVARNAADIPAGVLPPRVKIVLVHGQDPHTGEKVQNLAAAVRATRKRSEVFAFADSDGRVTKRWLRALVAPLSEPGVGAATGYRWFMPYDSRFWGLLRGVWDAAAVGLLGPGDNPFAWGGAMAIRKEQFFEAGVLERWKNTISDDYALSAAVHARGWKIAFAPGALVPCFEPISARTVFGWTRRQMRITRAYKPGLWWAATVAHVFYCAGMSASIIAAVLGHSVGLWTLAGQLLPGMIKGSLRAARVRRALPECDAWFRRWAWVHWAAIPAATWLWLTALLLSAFGSTIRWRGYCYDLKRGAAYNLNVREDFRGEGPKP